MTSEECSTTNLPGEPQIYVVEVDGISGERTAYSAAVRHESYLFLSGQTSCTDDGQILHDGDVRGQIGECLRNLGRVLSAAHTHRGAVVSATVYLTDATHAAALNEEWRAWFGDHRPARATVVVAQLLDPRLLLEISAIAVVPKTSRVRG